MKTGIHPQMFTDAKTTCVTCKAVFLIPSTVKDQQVEVCRMCHPVYTGKKQTEARGGRVERFRKIQAAARSASSRSAGSTRSTSSTSSRQASSGPSAGKTRQAPGKKK